MAKSRIHDEPHQRRGPTGRPVTASRPRVSRSLGTSELPCGVAMAARHHGCFSSRLYFDFYLP